MPDISYEALAGAALVIVLAVGYQYLPKSDTAASSKSKKKNKKKVKGKEGSEPNADESKAKGKVQDESVKGVQDGKAGKKDKQSKAKPKDAPIPSPITPSDPSPSFAEVAAPETKPKTLAQKIAPKNRKTKVDDMLASEDRPAEHARVMKVTEKPEQVPKYEDDYQYVDGSTSGTGTIEDDGWDVVPSKKKKPASTFTTTSEPLSVETKIQRKNAKKAEAKKAIKDAEEADRLQRLQQHKKGLEKERIAEIYKSKAGKTNGGAFASLDTNGKLVWD